MASFRLLLIPVTALCAVAAPAQQAVPFDDPDVTRAALRDAMIQGGQAKVRAERLEGEARAATAQADRTQREAAALAARIQQSEAEIAGHEARARMIARERAVLRVRLAQRQQPLVRLTAALQRLSRRPPALALLRPGSIRDTMHMRALFETLLPQIEQRTAALRAEIARSRALELRAQAAARNLRSGEGKLREQRQLLVSVEARQRLASRQATGAADRESERALALAEQAGDLGALVGRLDAAGALREQLASLPGPIARPVRPETAQVAAAAPSAAALGAPAPYQLPVTGRLVSGFGVAAGAGDTRTRGIVLAARAGAQVVAPASGRVAFAGPFRGFGRIVIIEHAGDWTTLVTGLTELDTRVGATLVAGSPLGLTGPGAPTVTLELRRGGIPVNPLEFIGKS